jgi:hypothetical protein
VDGVQWLWLQAIIFVVLARVLLLLVTATVVPTSLIPVTLMMGALRSSETSALTRATLRHVPKDGILQMQDKVDMWHPCRQDEEYGWRYQEVYMTRKVSVDGRALVE